MRNTLETRLGLFFALALVAAVIIFEMAGGLDIFQKGIGVRARFNSIQELKEGDPVKMAGVQIGRVQSIALAQDKVEVMLRLTHPEQVKTDSIATIKFVGLLGQNYVSVDFGSPNAPPADENMLLETTENVDLSTIMVKLESVASGVEKITKNFSGDSLNNLLGPLTDFLKENNPRLSSILENLRVTTTEIAQGEGTIGRLIKEDELYRSALETVEQLRTTTEDVKLTLADARSIVQQVNQGQGTMGRLIKDESLYQETTVAMTNLREILQKINRGEGSAGKLVNDDALYKNAKLTLQKVEKATEGIEDQGPLSVIGLVVSGLF